MKTARLHLSDTSIENLNSTVSLWLEDLKARNYSPNTLQVYRCHLMTFVRCVGNIPLHTVTPSHIRRYLIARHEAGLRSHTVFGNYRTLHAFFTWCVQQELLDTNPCDKVQAPRRETLVKRALTPEEVENLLKACEGKDWLRLRDRALILLLLDTGLRIHEAHSLRVVDILDSTCIVRGKGGKHRVVAFSPETRLALQRYLKACPYHPQAEQPLWYGGKGALTLNGIKQVVRDAGKRAGLPVGAHQLRRTFATWSLRQGISLEHLRLLMGHSDLKVLQQYLALVEEDLKQAHEQYSPLKVLRKGKT